MKKLEELGISPYPWWVSDDANGAVNNAVLCPDPTHFDKLFDYDVVKSSMIDGKYDYDDPRHEQEHKKFLANAHLIAAAPELYESLHEIIGDMCNHCDLRDVCQEGEDGMSSPCNMVHRAKAALAKAAGEEKTE